MTYVTPIRKLSSCPYCGEDKMSLDVNVTLTCKVHEDGTFSLNDWWTIHNIENEAIAGIGDDDIKGFCVKCGNYSRAKRTRDGHRICFFKEGENVE